MVSFKFASQRFCTAYSLDASITELQHGKHCMTVKLTKQGMMQAWLALHLQNPLL